MTKGSYWDAVAHTWADGRDRLWRAHSDALNLALCRRWLSDRRWRRLLKTDLFDESAGVGLWPGLASLADHVVAIDVSHAIASRAHAQHQVPALNADVRHLPFVDGAFDAVVSNSTLDHFDRHEAIADGLRELNRVLASGGRLLLTLDNGANPAIAIRNALPQRWLAATGLVPYEMGKTLRPQAARDLLSHTGFTVLHQTAIMHSPRVLTVPLARLVDRLATGHRTRERYLGQLERLEIAERWPTCLLTGHFVAFLAQKS